MDAEIAKCDKKLHLAQLSLDKIKKFESQADYEATVPANARLANEEKVCLIPPCAPTRGRALIMFPQRKTLEADIENLNVSKEMFAKLK